MERFEFLKKICMDKRFHVFLGLGAVILLLWQMAPRLGFSSILWRSIILITIMITLIIGYLVQQIVALKRGSQIESNLQTEKNEEIVRKFELQEIKTNLSQAIASLKASDLGVKYRGKAALYALPWYMIIGPSAAGKSTLLRESGLNFKYSANDDPRMRGIGGTRNCDWWFADEAIILDTAGRYTTESQDQKEWLGFLNLLKKTRPRLPLNGILVALNVDAVLAAEETSINWHANVIRERIAEIYRHLGFVVPVYIILTKVDLMPGFKEFFTDLNESERHQCFGIEFNYLNGYLDLKHAHCELEQLYHQLTWARLGKLNLERNVQRKFNLYEFPEVYNTAISRLMMFLEKLAKPNPYQETPNFLGLFFTSGTQQGTALSRLLGSMAQAFKLAENQETRSVETLDTKLISRQSYFIKNLLQEIIFPNQNLAHRNQKQALLYKSFKTLGIACSGISICVTFFLYSASYTANTLFLKRGATILQSLNQQFYVSPADHQQSLIKLIETFDFYLKLKSYRSMVPLHLRLGLYRGNHLLLPYQHALNTTMKTLFLLPMRADLIRRLQHLHERWPQQRAIQNIHLRGLYFLTLQNYLLLFFPGQYDSKEDTTFLTQAWLKNLKIFDLQNAYRDKLGLLISEYLIYLGHDKNSYRLLNVSERAIINYSRVDLKNKTTAWNLYAGVAAENEMKLGKLAFSQLLPEEGSLILNSRYELPAMFTKSAWYRIMQPKLIHAAANGWVLNVPLSQLNFKQIFNENTASTEMIKKQITDLYFINYADAWIKLLQSIKIKPFASLDEAEKNLVALKGNASPLAALLKLFFTNIDINNDILKNYFSGAVHIMELDKQGLVLSPTYQNALGLAANDLQEISLGANKQNAAKLYAQKIFMGLPAALLKSSLTVASITQGSENSFARQALTHILLAPIVEAWRSILNLAMSNLDELWQKQVINVYEQRIAGKYPFARSTIDAYPSDVKQFFSPNNGTLWSFVDKTLKPFIQYQDNHWQVRQWLGMGINISDQSLAALNQASRITKLLFSENNAALQFTYVAYPLPTPGLQTIAFNNGLAKLKYLNGPQHWRTMIWRYDENAVEPSRVEITNTKNQIQALEYEGPWSLFHLIDEAEIQTLPDNILKLQWQLKISDHNYPVALLMRPADQNVFTLLQNPFVLPLNLAKLPED